MNKEKIIITINNNKQDIGALNNKFKSLFIYVIGLPKGGVWKGKKMFKYIMNKIFEIQ